MNTRKPLPIHQQIVDLFLIEMTSWRWSWRGFVIVGTVTPLLSMLALGLFARDSGGEALTYVLTGNVVLALMFGVQNNVETHFVFMRINGTLAYFAALPVRRFALVIAVIMAFFVLGLPSVLVTLFVGAWLLGVPLQLHPLLIVVIPLCALSVAGIGALIGVSARNVQEANAINLLTTFVMISLGAVVIPPSKLPDVLVLLGRISPASYAASALRQTTVTGVTGQLWIDLIVLAGFTIAVFWFVERNLDWRER